MLWKFEYKIVCSSGSFALSCVDNPRSGTHNINLRIKEIWNAEESIQIRSIAKHQNCLHKQPKWVYELLGRLSNVLVVSWTPWQCMYTLCNVKELHLVWNHTSKISCLQLGWTGWGTWICRWVRYWRHHRLQTKIPSRGKYPSSHWIKLFDASLA